LHDALPIFTCNEIHLFIGQLNVSSPGVGNSLFRIAGAYEGDRYKGAVDRPAQNKLRQRSSFFVGQRLERIKESVGTPDIFVLEEVKCRAMIAFCKSMSRSHLSR